MKLGEYNIHKYKGLLINIQYPDQYDHNTYVTIIRLKKNNINNYWLQVKGFTLSSEHADNHWGQNVLGSDCIFRPINNNELEKYKGLIKQYKL